MAKRRDLLAAVMANPDDDGPRLVFADFLAEAGDPWGEYIACAIRGEQARAEELFKQHGASFAPEVKAVFPGDIGFERGFPGRLAIKAAELHEHGPALLAVAPISWLALSFLDDWAWLDTPGLERVRQLGLRVDSRKEPTPLIGATRLVGVRQLRITAVGAYAFESRGGSFADALAGSPLRPRALEFSFIKIAQGKALAASPVVASLETLQFGSWGRVKDNLPRALLGASFPELRRLAITSGRLAPATAKVLAKGAMPKLEELSLAKCVIEPKTLDALAKAPWLERLRSIDVEGCQTEDAPALDEFRRRFGG